MKIIIYNPNTEEFHDFINSPICDVPNRDDVINKYIEEIGTEISSINYWNNRDRYQYQSWPEKEKVCFIGEPTSILEKLINFIDNSPSYCHMTESFPEDFTESRTDWYDMKRYADEMSSFINELAYDLVSEKGGKL